MKIVLKSLVTIKKTFILNTNGDIWKVGQYVMSKIGRINLSLIIPSLIPV